MTAELENQHWLRTDKSTTVTAGSADRLVAITIEPANQETSRRCLSTPVTRNPLFTMPPDTQEEFLQKFHARRMAKHSPTKQSPTKRKANSPPPKSPPDMSRCSLRNLDNNNGADDDLWGMSFDIGTCDAYSDGGGGEPGPAIETTRSTGGQTMGPVEEKPAQGNDDTALNAQPVESGSQDKADQSAEITAASERAQAEIEAAGVHVKDFATGYETSGTNGV